MKNKNFGRKRQAIYILSNRKSTRIIKTLMDFFFFIKVKIKMVCFSVPSCLADGVAFYHLILGRKKAGDLFQISCLVCRCMGGGYLVVKVRGKLTRCADGKLGLLIWNRSYNANCYCINKKHKCYYTNN